MIIKPKKWRKGGGTSPKRPRFRGLVTYHPWRDVEAFKALGSELEVELGLRRVDRSVGRTHTRGAARDYECMQGLESFARWAKHEIGGRVEPCEVASWQALRDRLAEAGVRLVRRGNGLALVDARRPELACKASALGRAWSKGSLAARLGEFWEGPTVEDVTRRAARTYEALPLENTRDDGDAQRQRFKLRHHVIQAMPINGKEKRALYKLLAAEKAARDRALKAKINMWRMSGRIPAGRSWRAFLQSARRAAIRAPFGDSGAERKVLQCGQASFTPSPPTSCPRVGAR